MGGCTWDSLHVRLGIAQDGDSDTSGSLLGDEGITVHEARTLDELLESIRERRDVENLAHQQRIDAFERQVSNQASLLDAAEKEHEAETNRSRNLEGRDQFK